MVADGLCSLSLDEVVDNTHYNHHTQPRLHVLMMSLLNILTRFYLFITKGFSKDVACINVITLSEGFYLKICKIRIWRIIILLVFNCILIFLQIFLNHWHSKNPPKTTCIWKNKIKVKLAYKWKLADVW